MQAAQELLGVVETVYDVLHVEDRVGFDGRVLSPAPQDVDELAVAALAVADRVDDEE